ncbi:alpha-methylacyl-CoA racemase [Sitodiplosis mosellana]|uniref:alpha-methylacyl-CoA racemase n=1 Tax=Sitodiplosis mosellana TaxID=263140 RepID=UPI002444CA6F|nr:alpha-methylacyl-CoA racemase [Sitodiplosis mosellana]
MALKGIKVLELAGLAPGPHCGMILCDFGATVTRVDRIIDNPLDCLGKGKRTIAINIKSAKGQELVRALSKTSDVLIEPYRPGVMEKLNLGPEILLDENPRLIYARLTGFGQTGPLAKRAGHDINYVAMSGILSMLGRSNEPPTPPINLIADFAGGGLLCAFGILAAIVERHSSGKGQIVDCSMTEGAAYVGSWLTRSRNLPIWGGGRGENILDGGAFYYGTYETSDGKYMSVGALEPQFYSEFMRILELDFDQFDPNIDKCRKEVQQIFKTKTQSEWSKLFESVDACVFPVLQWKNAEQHPHNNVRNSFVSKAVTDGIVVPTPAPLLSRTPAVSGVQCECQNYSKQIEEIFKDAGLTAAEVKKYQKDGALILPNSNAKL